MAAPKKGLRVAVRDGRRVMVRTCLGCGKEGVCSDGPDRDFPIKRRDAAGRITEWHARCLGRLSGCYSRWHKQYVSATAEQRRAAARKYYRRLREDPERVAEMRKRWRLAAQKLEADPVKLAAKRAQHRAYTARRRATERDKVNEEHRMGYRLRRERAGLGLTVRQRPTVIDGTSPRVAAEPFATWTRAFMAETNMEIEQAALELGVAAVLLRRYLDGQETVALDVVDRALIHANRTVSVDGRLVVILDDLYPLLDDAAEAA